MRTSRGIVCEEVAGKPKHLRGYTGFLSNMYSFSAPGAMSYFRLFSGIGRVLDVGAGIGGWTLAAMRAWGWDIEAHLFEPNPETLRDLNYNMRGMGNVHIHPVAAMNQVGIGKLVLPSPGTGDKKNVGQLSLVQDGMPVANVRMARIDDVLPDFCPDFVKIDVEGAEPDVLLGAEKMILRSKPVLFIETRRTFSETSKIVRRFGYARAIKLIVDHFFIHEDAPRFKDPEYMAKFFGGEK